LKYINRRGLILLLILLFCKKRVAHPTTASQVSSRNIAKKAALEEGQQYRMGTNCAWGMHCPNLRPDLPQGSRRLWRVQQSWEKVLETLE